VGNFIKKYDDIIVSALAPHSERNYSFKILCATGNNVPLDYTVTQSSLSFVKIFICYCQ